MAIDISKAKITRILEGTPGGKTYYVLLPDAKKSAPHCYRKIHHQENMRCTNVAGYGTSHVGTGACKFHGGADKTPPITTGKRAFMTKTRLNGKIEHYLDQDRDQLLDLTRELAATRAIFDEFMGNFPDPNDEDYGVWFNRFNLIISTMGTLVEKISKNDSRNALTAAQVLYIRATITDLFMKYLTDPDDRVRAVKELASRLGGDIEVDNMRRSECNLPSFVDGELAEVGD